VAFEQHLQHAAADRRQPLRALGAAALGVMERIRRATLVVVIRGVKNRM
jgi:hypothetical protein